MQSGIFTSSEVLNVSRRVLVNGVHRPHIGTDLSADHGVWPGGGGGGVSSRTVEIEFAHSGVVVERSETPWNPPASDWPPRRGDSVRIVDDVTTVSGPYSYTRFTGRVDDVYGGRSLSVSCIDGWDEYRHDVTVLPMLARMPGVRTGEESAAAHYTTYLAPFGPVYRAMEACGKGVLPPVTAPGSTVFHAPFIGGIVPTVGGVMVGASARYQAGNGQSEYVEDMTLAESWGASAGAGSGSLAVTLRAPQSVFTAHAPAHPAVILRGSNNAEVVVNALANGTVQVYLSGALVATVATGGYGSDLLLGVSVLWSGTTLRVYTIGTGAEQSVTVPAPPSLPNATCRVRWLTGVRVTRGETLTQWRATARAVMSAPYTFRWAQWGQLLAASRLYQGSAFELIEEWARAQLMMVWIDEHGSVEAEPLDRLVAGTPVALFSTSREIADLPWRQSWQHLRSRTGVSYQRAAVTSSGTWRTLLWQPSSAKQIRFGDSPEEFAEPNTNQDWIDPDFSFSPASMNPGFGTGSVWGAVYTNEGIDTEMWAESRVAFDATPLGPAKVLLWHTTAGLLSTQTATLKTPEEWNAPVAMKNVPLPIIRGRGLTEWSEERVYSAVVGPAWAPEFVHELGWWGRPTDAGLLNNWLTPRLTTAITTLQNLDVGYDPRLQIGDVYTIDAGPTHGVRLTVLLTGIKDSDGPGGISQTITVQVLTAVNVTTQWRIFEDAWSTRTYADFEAAWGNSTYAALAADPLARS